MEAFKHLPKIFTLILGIVVVSGAYGQEYDDMYFTAKDRKKAEKKALEKDDSRATYQSYTNNTYADNYSTHEVNPEYIARYQANPEYHSDSDYTEYTDEENASYSQPSYSNISYYPEEYAENANGGTTVINNYYGGSNQFRAGDPFLDSRINFYMGYGFHPMYASWGNSLWGWGSNPWYDPYWGYGVYDPFYDPYSPFFGGFGWGSYAYGGWGRVGFGFGYGWNRWNRFNHAYNAGFYNGLYYGGYYNGNEGSVNRRDIVRGSRYSRGGVGSRSSDGRSRVNTVANNSGRANISSASRSGRSDYSATQNEYFRRSRTGLSSDSRTTAVSRTSSRTSSESYNSSSRSRSDNSSLRSASSSGSRRYSSSSVESSRSSTSSNSSRSSYTPSNSSRSSRSYTPSSSNSRSSYTPSNSSSGSRSSYTPSRSSSGSSRSSTPSSSGSRSSSSSRSGRGGGR